MRGRRKEAANRAAEIKDQAREVAGQSGEALKGFAEQTGSAAKEFATKTRDAAKDLVDQIESAAKGVAHEEPKRGRRLLKTTLAIGVGVALFTNERVRGAISSMLGRGGSEPPEVWRPDGRVTTDGEARTAAAIAEESS
jgi:uncharacterized protein YjbJ (UPF0337 family)